MSIRKSEPERETLFVCNVKVPEQRARGLDPVAVTRLEALASLLALWQRPATRRLLTFCGTSVRYEMS